MCPALESKYGRGRAIEMGVLGGVGDLCPGLVLHVAKGKKAGSLICRELCPLHAYDCTEKEGNERKSG